MTGFNHLHVHTEFSLLDGLSKIPKLVEKAKSLGQTSLAITDHGVMHGVINFYNTAKAAGIKPIIGVEAYMSETSRFEKQARMGADQYHLTLLAKTNIGYKNLMKLVSQAHLEGFSYKPRVDLELLAAYHQDVIMFTGCSSGIIPQKLLQNSHDEAAEWLKKFHKIFGPNFYVEIQTHHDVDAVTLVRPHLINLAKTYGIPMVATNDVHYIEASDADAQDALLAVQTRKTIHDPNRLSMADSPDFYVKSEKEMRELFSDIPEAIDNTLKIADECNVEIPIGKMIFPEYPLEPGDTPESALKKLAYSKLTERYPQYGKNITDRLDYELDVICSKGYASYFLIVQDFVNWAKHQGIRVGPGRGSAAGSIVSYVLRITSIDPIEHVLPFERFMNPQRPSPPDIDIDIADVHRDEVIKYVSDKYGHDHVAQVITFGTMEARAAIRDIGRVLGLPFSEPDKIAKLIPPGKHIDEAIATVIELQDYYKEPALKRLLDLAKKVEGNARHASVHAAAVVIADKPLTEYTPIQRESKNGKIVTQYDMYALDLNVSDNAVGLLKMDFLGLRNLSILGKAIEYVKQQTKESVDLSSIPLNDAKVFTMLSRGETTGVFQLESAGMRRVARQLKPSRFSDITAMVALYRPGPMELIDDFISGKNNPATVKYPHDDLKPVLEETYGIPVYQEQVLQIANVFAGYSLGEADILRRAIGKKKRYILEKEKKRFIRGAAEKGYTEKKAAEIWNFIDKFAGYGFNKAHSASYAMIAYQTAYMKANYPVEYMAALLSIEAMAKSANKDEKISQGIDECKRMNIKVLPPHINHSQESFSIETFEGSLQNKAIRFGLSAIKNVGEAAIESILEARQDGGDFSSVSNFCSRIDTRRVNKKVFESLIKVGCFDGFGKRSAILASLDEIREKAVVKQKQKESGQVGLFDVASSKSLVEKDKLLDIAEFSTPEMLKDEKNLLGVYLSAHPFSTVLKSMQRFVTLTIGELDPGLHSQRPVKLGGVITAVRQVYTKTSNAEMAFATLEDTSHKLDLVLFPKTYANVKTQLEIDAPYIVKGKLDVRDDKFSLIVSDIERFYADDSSGVTKIIEIPRGTDSSVLKQIGELLKKNPGDDTIEIHVPNGLAPKIITLPYKVDFTSEVALQVENLLHPIGS